MPVNTIAMPCSSAAAITSSSRIEPPGWITAVMPAGRGLIDAVAEREERVPGHHRAPHFQICMLGLDAGNARAVDAAHLAGTDADGHVVTAVDDGIGLDELGHPPGEQQILHFLPSGRVWSPL